MRKPLTFAALILSGLLAAGCDNDGPMENAGEAIDDTIDDVSDSVEEAGDEVEDAVDNPRQ